MLHRGPFHLEYSAIETFGLTVTLLSLLLSLLLDRELGGGGTAGERSIIDPVFDGMILR
ncbi:hypothetical protein [Dermacoccus nishinomiyaensis]|uniref:hypothetical protein n=1 Tax=Dermacoccus nishinomiyaensis TaxID=1274 RepID=UPI0033A19EE6